MDGISSYKENAITTQPRIGLVVLLYEGAVKFLNQAVESIGAARWAEKGQQINKAIEIIHELDACLDMAAGGEIAGNLRSLYTFMVRHLNQANVSRDPEMIREVIELLEELNEGWKAIAG